MVGVSIPIQIQLDWDYDASKHRSPSSSFQGRIEREVSTKYGDEMGRGIPLQRSITPDRDDRGWNDFPSNRSALSPSRNERSPVKRKSPPGQFEREALETHNKYRKIHGVPLLELSDELNKYAKDWADYLAESDSFNHRPDGPYGENLFLTYGSGDTDCDGMEPVDSWYSEGKTYSYGQSSGSSSTGHFTQVVWKDCKRLGMAKSRSSSGKTIVVANYDPPGNFIGNYSTNVVPPKNQ
uniref:Golgi-associated plant pathogenesis-related protein 1 n=1 Tax=Caligus clemensi TaxID=344056 RepID=C1C2Y4_CALCM|nr:Golgi-associated plant pathogenesis-related protein 1 [Caligus clemensi]